jgi:hypothetical protein
MPSDITYKDPHYCINKKIGYINSDAGQKYIEDNVIPSIIKIKDFIKYKTEDPDPTYYGLSLTLITLFIMVLSFLTREERLKIILESINWDIEEEFDNMRFEMSDRTSRDLGRVFANTFPNPPPKGIDIAIMKEYVR